MRVMRFSVRCGQICFVFFFQAEDGIRDLTVTGVQTCALPIFYNDEWMRQNGYLQRYPLHATVLDVVKDRMGTPGLIVVSKAETVRSAIETMQRDRKSVV